MSKISKVLNKSCNISQLLCERHLSKVNQNNFILDAESGNCVFNIKQQFMVYGKKLNSGKNLTQYCVKYRNFT